MRREGGFVGELLGDMPYERILGLMHFERDAPRFCPCQQHMSRKVVANDRHLFLVSAVECAGESYACHGLPLQTRAVISTKEPSKCDVVRSEP